MHIHRLEKIWLAFGVAMLALFLAIVGVSAFAMGMQTPHSHAHQGVDPTRLNETPPFDQPGLFQTGENQYEAVMIAYAFGFTPGELEVPAGAKIDFVISSPDVVHGFEIVGTNVNLMAVPGEVNRVSYTFDKPGEYLIVCNEYCGVGHQMMYGKLIVTEAA